MMKVSRPRTFSRISTKISRSAKRRTWQPVSGSPRKAGKASASGRLELPAKIFILPGTAYSPNARSERALARARWVIAAARRSNNMTLVLRRAFVGRLSTRKSLLRVAEGRTRGRGLGSVGQIGRQILGAFGGNAVQRRIVDHRPGVVAGALDCDRIAESLGALLVRREHVPDDIDLRSTLDQGGRDVAAREVA